MIRICLVGTGNVAVTLAREIRDNEALTLVKLIGRDQNKLPKDLINTPFSNQFNTIPICDVVLVSVSDNAIHEVSLQLPLTDAIVAHTSGASSIDLLNKHEHRGVIYPLQTFSKHQQSSSTSRKHNGLICPLVPEWLSNAKQSTNSNSIERSQNVRNTVHTTAAQSRTQHLLIKKLK